VPYNGFTTFTETIRFREFNPEEKEKDYGGPEDPITEQVCGS
jgi:hypothetical protein